MIVVCTSIKKQKIQYDRNTLTISIGAELSKNAIKDFSGNGLLRDYIDFKIAELYRYLLYKMYSRCKGIYHQKYAAIISLPNLWMWRGWHSRARQKASLNQS